MPKRAATPSKAAGRKKAREEDPMAKCGDIASMVKEARDDYPADVLKMLAGSVHSCLARMQDERHEFQSRTVDMIAQALNSVEARRIVAVAELEQKVASADGEQAARDALVDAAGEELKAKTGAADAAKAAAKEASRAEEDAAAALAAAKAEQKEGDAMYEKAVQGKAKLEAMLSGEYSALKLHTSGGLVRPLKALRKLGAEFEFDDQLMEAAAVTLPKAPEARGTFDKLVISELDALFASTINTLNERINGDEAARVGRAAHVEAATAAHAAAAAFAGERKAALEAASEAARAAEAAKKENVRSARDFGPEMKTTKANLSEAKDALAEVQDVLAAFKALVERTTPPPEPAAEARAEAATGAAGEAAAAA